MRPQLQAFLSDHAGEVSGHAIDEDQALSDLYDLAHGQSKLEWSLPLRASAPLPDVGISPECAKDVVMVAISCVAVVFQAAGVPASVTRAASANVVNAAIAESPAILVALQAEVAALSRANGLWDQAKAVFNLFSTINKAVAFTTMIKAIKDQLSWYQWILIGVMITATLTLWLATDGIAAIAELVLFGAALGNLVIDSVNAYNVCNGRATGVVRATQVTVTDSQPGAFVSIDVGLEPLAMLASGATFKGASDGTWTDMNLLVEDFSAGFPSTAFPNGQLWVIDQNGDSDGMISYIDYTSGQKVPTNAQASLISTADDGETWAIQSTGGGMRWDTSTKLWTNSQGVFTQIAVSSANLQWALVLASPNNPQTFISQRTSSANASTYVAASPEATNIIQISTNAAGDLVCVTTDNRVFQYVNEGSTWIQLGGDDLEAQSIRIRDPKNAWLIDTNGQAQNLGPLLNPSHNPGSLQWDTEDVWDETKSTHLYVVNRAAQLVATCTNPSFQTFVQQQIQPMVGKDQAGAFRRGLCQGLYDADFKSDYNNPNWLGQPTWKSHFYDASTGQNYMHETTPTALSNGVAFLQQSLTTLHSTGDLYNGGYFLGLALHYFTDLTQPMHAANYHYLSSFPFGYHTDFEAYTMSVQATVTQPTVTGFQAGSVNDITALYQTTAATFKQKYFSPVEQAHMYASWKWSPATWQAAVLPLLPRILNDAVSATAQLLYVYLEEVVKYELELNGNTNGSGSYIQVLDAPDLHLAQSLTLEARVKWDGAVGYRAFISKPRQDENGSVGTGYTFALTDGKPILGIITESGVNRAGAIAAAPIPANTWISLAATYDGRVSITYINGVEVARQDWGSQDAAAQGPTPLLLGREFLTGLVDRAFGGSMTDVRLWKVALPPQTITAWFDKSSVSDHPNLPDLVAGWLLDEGSGLIVRDMSDHGHDGALMNGASWRAYSSTADFNGKATTAGLLAPVLISEPVA